MKKAKHIIQNNNKDLMAQAKQMLAAGDKLGDDAQKKLAVSAAAGSVAAKEVIAQTGIEPAHSKEEETAETKDVGESDQEDADEDEDEDEEQEDAVGESDDADGHQDDNDEAENEDVGDDDEEDGTNKAAAEAEDEDEDEDDDIGDDDEEDDDDDEETENNDDDDEDDDDELGETNKDDVKDQWTPQDAVKRDSQWDTKAFGAANGTQWPKAKDHKGK